MNRTPQYDLKINHQELVLLANAMIQMMRRTKIRKGERPSEFAMRSASIQELSDKLTLMYSKPIDT